ncbi:MAG: hypothetical protein DRJ36_02060 [Thermoprotei archaeon]|nr:MAG: hypothetical protein DRJ36_02060 [Thermoprotei archaeon]
MSIEELINLAIALGTGIITAHVLTPLFMVLMRKKGIVREDCHKPGKPKVAYCGGIAIFLAFSTSILTVTVLFPYWRVELYTLWGTSAISFLIGLIDDLKILKGEVKTALSVLPVIVIVLAAFLWPERIILGRPRAPFVGRLRLTIMYWILLPLAIAGPANVVNMLDIMNGIMPLTSIMILLSLSVASYLVANPLGILASFTMMGALLGYYPYNKYPAKIFSGDSGSLMVGAFLGALAVLTRLELVVLIALLPHLLNAFLILSSTRSLKEHREIKARPLLVLEDGTLIPSTDNKAPLSLTRLMLLIGGSADEKEVIEAYMLLQLTASILAIITGWLVAIS